MIEDIKGYKPHTDDKIGKVNAIKDAEVRLGLMFKALEEEHVTYYMNLDTEEVSEQELDQAHERITQIRNAIDRLKEASMWACRSVFQPEEKY
uniref:Acb2/Tad1 hairpin domain-containing protein n=1 Tax=Escherichia phage fDHCT2 TaxID=3075956 RepID=A0AB38Z2G0_9CAUD